MTSDVEDKGILRYWEQTLFTMFSYYSALCIVSPLFTMFSYYSALCISTNIVFTIIQQGGYLLLLLPFYRETETQRG